MRKDRPGRLKMLDHGQHVCFGGLSDSADLLQGSGAAYLTIIWAFLRQALEQFLSHLTGTVIGQGSVGFIGMARQRLSHPTNGFVMGQIQ